mmetsp:Transcript_22249/g.55039  ORF Transcript_22249/g.55039 Transcript_22249/m.55039 type:complete len:314 (-) Transcript_22249:2128-3069(-)
MDRKKLPERTSRGKRMSLAALDAEQLQADTEFWNQSALAESASDSDFETSGDSEDVVDSDFDNEEPETFAAAISNAAGDGAADAEDALRREERETRASARKKQRIGKEPRRGAERGGAGEARATRAAAKSKDPQDRPAPVAKEKMSFRKSTKIAAEQSKKVASQREVDEEERRRIRLEREARKPKERVLTQAELLEEAKRTEELNRRSLAELLRFDEEKKRTIESRKHTSSHPTMRQVSSSGGKTQLVFSHTESIPAFPAPPPYPDKQMCAVTGKSARYRDPDTGLPFYDSEAFKKIRSDPARYANPAVEPAA